MWQVSPQPAQLLQIVVRRPIKRLWRRIRRAFYNRMCEFVEIEEGLWKCSRCEVEQERRTVRRCAKQVKYLGDAVEAIIIVLGGSMTSGCGCQKRKRYLNKWSRKWAKRIRRGIDSYESKKTTALMRFDMKFEQIMSGKHWDNCPKCGKNRKDGTKTNKNMV